MNWSLGAPGFLTAAMAAAAVVVALHLLAWRRPTPTPFPTARWIPESAVRAVSRDLRLTDVLLLLTRVLAIVLTGLALSAPRIAWPPRGEVRVIVADRSRAVANIPDVRDSVRSLDRAGESVVIWFDSAARVGRATDSVTATDVRGSLSAALVLARREMRDLLRRVERVEIVVVSPWAREELDAATLAIGQQLPAAIRSVRVAAAVPAVGEPNDWQLPPVDDAIGAAFRVAMREEMRGRADVRVVRAPPSAADSTWARDGGVLVHWPRASRADTPNEGESVPRAGRRVGGADAPNVPPVDRANRADDADRTRGSGSSAAASARGAAASVVMVEGEAVVAPFLALPDAGSDAGEPIAFWADGTPAARELVLGRGCARTIQFAPPPAGDLVLRPAFSHLVRAIASPCGRRDWGLLTEGEIAQVGRGDETTTAAATGANSASPVVRPNEDVEPDVRLVRIFLLAAFVLLMAEWWLRRDARRAEGRLVTGRRAATNVAEAA